MSNSWFTERGASGTLDIERQEDGWFVSASDDLGTTKILTDSRLGLDGSEREQRIEVVVDSFRRGVGQDVNYLSVSPMSDAGGAETGSETGRDVSSDQETLQSRNDDWTLSEFNGTGEYVNVEATVDAVHMVKKGISGIPDIKGELTDDSVFRPVVFVVEDGVEHPRLDEGKTFRFENVKDHYYRNGGEVQVKISSRTKFLERT